MTLPAAASSHHTAWVDVDGHRVVAVRYASSDGSLVCLGDDGLQTVSDGDRVNVTIHEIQNGPPLVSFPATVRELQGEELSLHLVSEVLGHRPPRQSFEQDRRSRRFLALQP